MGSPYLFHVLIEEVKDIPLLFLHPVTFHMVIPGAPWHCRNHIYSASLMEMILPIFKMHMDLWMVESAPVAD